MMVDSNKAFYLGMAGMFGIMVLAATCEGCASPGLPTGYNVQISSDFSASDVALIEQSFTEWTSLGDAAPTFSFAIVDHLSFPDDSDVPWAVIEIKHADHAQVVSSCNNTGDSDTSVIACTAVRGVLAHDETGAYNLLLGSTGPVMYLPTVSEVGLQTSSPFTQVVSHEVGHACGLHHTGTGTVMCATTDCAAKAPTCADLKQYAAERPWLDASTCKGE